MISEPKTFASFSASPIPFTAKSEPSNGTRIFLYIGIPPPSVGLYITIEESWQQKRSSGCHPSDGTCHRFPEAVYSASSPTRRRGKESVLIRRDATLAFQKGFGL